MTAPTRTVRWVEDAWEHRCEVCWSWWPLDDEFWIKRTMSRCRACWNEYKRLNQNARYQTDPQFREDKKAAARLSAWKERTLRPERLRVRKSLYYRRHRDEILAGMRERYWRSKGERAA